LYVPTITILKLKFSWWWYVVSFFLARVSRHDLCDFQFHPPPDLLPQVDGCQRGKKTEDRGTRVTRWVCEKVAQNVAQQIICQK
jgi:hypothetical protein